MLDIVSDTQFGDGGKGRVIADLALKYSSFYSGGLRSTGADNAGHTVYSGREKFVLSLLPCCVFADKPAYLGRGMALNLSTLLNEILLLEKGGFSPKIMIDPSAHMIMPWHIDLDRINEERQGMYAAGSTRKGVAPVFASKHERTGIRVVDFLQDSTKVNHMLDLYARRVAFAQNGSFLHCKERYINSLSVLSQSVAFLEKILGEVSYEIHDQLKQGKHFLGECSQSEMLDVNNPYYPYGTSSGTNGGAAFWDGIGIAPRKEFLGQSIGVAKAYVTRVGNGPFVTEIEGAIADEIREKGNEYGSRTGRPRRIGWLDIPMIKHAVIPSGLTSLAITKLDILGGMENIPVAVHYQGGDTIPHLCYENVSPHYKIMQGWPAFSSEEYKKQLGNGISHIENYALRSYLEMIQEEVGLPISMLSFGPHSEQFLCYDNPF